MGYRKIPKISPGSYIFQKPFLGGLFLRWLIYGGKFEFLNRLGQLYSWKQLNRFCFVLLCIFEGNFPCTSPRRAYIWRGDLKEGFLRYQFRGLIFGGPQCSSQSAPLRESRKRSRDGPHQKRSKAIMALSFFNSLGLKMSLFLQLQ